jgi:hypothetical protein
MLTSKLLAVVPAGVTTVEVFVNITKLPALVYPEYFSLLMNKFSPLV